MSKDNNTEDTELLEKDGEDQSDDTQDENLDDHDGDDTKDDKADDADDQGDGAEDKSDDSKFRAIVNAQNRFLEKEGYEFEDGKWRKKADEGSQKKEPKPAKKATETLSKAEVIAYAKGHTEEEVEKAKKIAVLEEIPLSEALESDLFKSWKSENERKKKERDAQLGGSRGSRAKVKKTFATKGLSDDDHKELFKEKVLG